MMNVEALNPIDNIYTNNGTTIWDINELPYYDAEPYDFNGHKVPDILYSGNHTAIKKWRRKESLKLTLKHRPDLLKNIKLSKSDLKLIDELKNCDTPEWEKAAIEKGHKFIKKN